MQFVGAVSRVRTSRLCLVWYPRIGATWPDPRTLVWKNDDVKFVVPLLLAGTISAGCASTSPDATHTMTGQVIDSSSSVAFNRQPGKTCAGGGIGPIYPAGTEVKVISYRAKHTQTMATGLLSSGTTRDGGHVCQWNFTVNQVRDAGTYLVEVVNGPGGIFRESQVQQTNWNVTLGSTSG